MSMDAITAMAVGEDGIASLLAEISSLASDRTLSDFHHTSEHNNGSSGIIATQDRSDTCTAAQGHLYTSSADVDSSTRPAVPSVIVTPEKDSGELHAFSVGAYDSDPSLGGAAPGHGSSTAMVVNVLPREHLPPDVGQSLPEIASQLLQTQSTQHVEVARREGILRELKLELQKEKDRLQSMKRDIYSASKAICLAQDQGAQVDLECEKLEKEISTLVHETQRLREGLQDTRGRIEEEERSRRACREKMERHRVRAEEVEQACPVQQELEGLRISIDDLKDQRGSYMQGEGLLILSGERQGQLQELIAANEAKRAGFVQENIELQKQVQAGNQHVVQVKREVEVAKKRQQAQLTRLHRQVQEAQARRRQWGEEADRLKAAIAQLKYKIEE